MTISFDPSDHDEGALVAARIERRWVVTSAAIVGLLIGMAIFAGIHRATMPQAWVETANPQTLHISGEFIESNLGSAVEADGSVTVRALGQQYSFTPQCMLVPTETPVTFRATSSDVVHGFLITRTNINSMLVPGYVSILPAKFDKPGEHPMPCQEFCGIGHEGMWAKVKVIDKATFLKMAADRRRLSCVE
jgi:cytochrome c oxidase subunit 2